jgi:antitoxin (DNA-binding transcriptional repressor) of toxin-antitoxin stability system
MTIRTEIGTAQLSDLVKQVQTGDEILLTDGNKPVAKLVSVGENGAPAGGSMQIRAFKGHRVLTPNISQSEIAENMFQKP